MTLLKPQYQYQTINREEVNGKRHYCCPDGDKVPSVTTILSATQSEEKKQILENWRNTVGHARAKATTEEAAHRGSRMHKYLEDYLEIGKLRPPGSNPYSQESHVMARTIVDNGLVNFDEFWGSEVALYYPEIYAGTADGVGVHKGDPAILDFKQSNKPKTVDMIDDYFLQLTSYALCHNKIYGTDIKKGVILMCVKPPEISPGKWGIPTYQEFILEPADFSYWENKWWDKVEKFYTQLDK